MNNPAVTSQSHTTDSLSDRFEFACLLQACIGKCKTGSLHEKTEAAAVPKSLVSAFTAAACRSHLSSHALNAKSPSVPRLEDHRVWPVRAAEAEAGAKVVDEVSLSTLR